MIAFDSTTKEIKLDLPGGEAQFMKEFSSITAVLRDKLYEEGHNTDEVNNMCFAAFRMGMENTKAFPHSIEAQNAIQKLNKSSNGNRELPLI